MTTIAYHHKSKEISIDSRVSSGSLIISDSYDKIIKNDFGLWFMCGSTADYEEYSNLRHNEKIDNADNVPDCCALVIKDGKCYGTYIEDSGYFKVFEEMGNTTIGSGSKLALAALDMGKSAKEAVEYAATRDAFTGGNIQSFLVNDLPKHYL